LKVVGQKDGNISKDIGLVNHGVNRERRARSH